MQIYVVTENLTDSVVGVFSDEAEAKSAALLTEAEVETWPVESFVQWYERRNNITRAAEAARVEHQDEETRLEAERQAAWLARDRSKDPEPAADLSNVHVEGPRCECLACRARRGPDWASLPNPA